MKKIIISTLMCLIIQSTALCMKRKHEDTSNTAPIAINKKPTREIILPATLHNFFIHDTVFEKPIPSFEKFIADKNKNQDTYQKLFIPYLPNDLKNTIRTLQFFYDKEWWYNTQTYTYSHTPYGVAFINDNLVVGLNKDIHLINPNTGEILHDSFNTQSTVQTITVNNNYLAYGLVNGTVKVMDFLTKEIIFNCSSDSSPWSLAFDKEKQHLAIGQDNKIIEIHSIREKKTTFSCITDGRPYGLSYLNNNDLISGENSGKIYTLDHKINKKTPVTTVMGPIFALACSNDSAKYAIGLKNGIVQIIDQKTHNVILSTDFKSPIYSLAFDKKGENLVVGVDDHSLHILQQFHPTYQQLMLRQLFTHWLHVKTHDKTINSIPAVLNSVARLFQLNKTELTQTWETFPTKIQTAVWQTINKMIQKYGYNPQTMEDFCCHTNINAMKFTELDARIISQYFNPTIKQLLLRKIIQLFFNTETIAHNVCSPEELLSTISCAFKLYNAELLAIWESFPHNVQQELWEQFNRFIQQKIK